MFASLVLASGSVLVTSCLFICIKKNHLTVILTDKMAAQVRAFTINVSSEAPAAQADVPASLLKEKQP